MPKKLDFKARLAVQKAIEANGTFDEATGFWVYNEGWNDQRVSQETGATREAVAHTRSQTFGRVRRGPGANGPRDRTSRVAQLEQEVANLKARMRHLEELYLPNKGKKLNSGTEKIESERT